MKVVIMTVKSWNISNVRELQNKNPDLEVYLITEPSKVDIAKIREFNPELVFVIHWSWYVPEQIYASYESIVFHPAPLPFGRGGSPIQNLIVRGYEETEISAVKVGKELDAGDLYPVSKKLYLHGSVEEILINMSKIICFEMIPEIIKKRPLPVPQQGDIVVFKRKKPEESMIDFGMDLEEIYDKIRMLDGEGYPRAFVELGEYRLEFSRASIKRNGILSDVIISKNDLKNGK